MRLAAEHASAMTQNGGDPEDKDEPAERPDEKPSSAIVPVPVPRRDGGAGSTPPGNNNGGGGGRTSLPPMIFAPLAELGREAIQAEERRSKHQLELEQQTYLKALEYDDKADERKVQLERVRLEHDQKLASRRLTIIASLVGVAVAGTFALGFAGYVREALEIAAIVVFSGMSFLTGREVGRRQSERPPASNGEQQR